MPRIWTDKMRGSQHTTILPEGEWLQLCAKDQWGLTKFITLLRLGSFILCSSKPHMDSLLSCKKFLAGLRESLRPRKFQNPKDTHALDMALFDKKGIVKSLGIALITKFTLFLQSFLSGAARF